MSDNDNFKITNTRAWYPIPVLMFLNKLMQYQFTYLTVAKQWIAQISKDEGLQLIIYY